MKTSPLYLVAVAALWSCTDDPVYRNADDLSDNEMHFTSWISTNNANSRADADNLESFTAEKCENSDMYLVTTIEDGIDGTKLDTYDKEAEQKMYEEMSMAQSRAAMLTSENMVSSYLQNDGYSIGLYAFKYPKRDVYNSKTDYNYTLDDVITEFEADTLKIVKAIDGDILTYSSISDDKNTVSLTSANKHYWDMTKDNNMTFCAIFPSKEAYAKIASSDYVQSTYAVHTSSNRAVLRFAIETDPDKQFDVLYAQKSCAADGSSSNNKIPFEMKHIMTGINVTLGDGFSGYYITGVRIGGASTSSDRAVNTLGRFNMATGKWEALPAGERYSRNLEYSCASSDKNTSLDGKLFMVIPQTLGESSTNGGIASSCYLEITVKNPTTNTTEMYTKDITGTSWPQGKTVNYQLSTSRSDTKYYISTEYSTMKYGWNGEPAGNGTSYTDSQNHTIDDVGYIRVKSYKRTITSDGGTATKQFEEVPWTAYDQNNTKVISSENANMVISTNSFAKDYRSFSENDENYEFESKDFNFMFKHTLGAQTASTWLRESNDKLKLAANTSNYFGNSNSQAGRIDLSKFKQASVKSGDSYYAEYWYKNSDKASISTSRETANCYMIKYAGNYTLPCVYGNAIRMDSHFEVAYKDLTNTNSSDGRVLNNLWCHNNMTPKSHWINNTACGEVPTKAVSVWQDYPDLVTNLEVYKDPTAGKEDYYLNFDVPKSSLKPGNAVIAVTNDNGMILWSWHIWITPYAYDADNSNKVEVDASANGGNFKMSRRKFLKVPLGYVEGDTLVWAARTKVLTLKQQDASGNQIGSTTTVTLQQDEHVLPQNHCCYYQWGRKDPFPGALASETETKGVMDYNGQYKTTVSQVPLYNLGSGALVATATKWTMGEFIQKPYLFYAKPTAGSYNAFPPDKNFCDLWGDNLLYTKTDAGSFGAEYGTRTKKTIYDPCPIEFKVPPIHAFPQFSANSGNYATAKTDWVTAASTDLEIMRKLNTPYTSILDFINNGGMAFYCNAMSNGAVNAAGGSFKLPAFGYIDASSSKGAGVDGNLVYKGVGTSAWYWSNSRSAFNATSPTGQRVYNVMFGYTDGLMELYQVYGGFDCRGEPIFAMFDDYNLVW